MSKNYKSNLKFLAIFFISLLLSALFLFGSVAKSLASFDPTLSVSVQDDQVINQETVDPWSTLYADLQSLISTDKEDYSPTELVTISGSGFYPEMGYVIELTSIDDFYFVDTFVTDSDGGFVYEYQLDGVYRPEYKVYIRNYLNEVVAEISFLDSAVGTYDQCSNDDGDGYATGDTECRWVNGNLNGTNSTYMEGDATVQRLWLNGFEPGSDHTITLQYGTTKGGSHAYDFLTSWDWSESWVSDADRCQGVDGCTGVSDHTFAIPLDPNALGFDSASREMTARGAELTGVSIPTLVSGTYASDSETAITVSFDVAGSGDMCETKGQSTTCGVALWFGAHIAKTDDWFPVDESTGAGGIEGSPYHVSLSQLDDGAIGERDNQMQASAVVVPEEGNIVVIKETLPDGDTTSFEFNPSWVDNFNLTDGESHDSGPILAGDYSVEEIVPSGWDLTNVSCVSSIDDQETADAIELDAEETVTCTFTNTKRANIVVIKDAISNNAQDFTFNNDFGNGNPATFQLDDDNNATLSNSRNSEVLPGTYSVSEDAVAGWQQESATCTNGETIDSIDVAAGETVSCTFVNERLARIVLVKNTVGGDGTFDFVMTGDGLPENAQLTTTSGTQSQTFEDLDQDNTYSISETPIPTGWQLDGAECTGGNTPASITPDPGERVTCTFTNSKLPTLTVNKVLVPSDDAGFFNLLIDDVSEADNVGDGGTTGQVEVSIGAHEVSESAGTDTELEDYYTEIGGDCDAEGSITLAAGDNKTCWITNTRILPLEVTKDATTTFIRTYGWEIRKSVTPPLWNLFVGDSGTSRWSIAVRKDDGTDSDWAVTGQITISNPNSLPALAASLDSVTDEVLGSGAMLVDCEEELPYLLPSGGGLVCTYSGALASGDDTTNTATVVVAPDSLVPGGSGEADVVFGEPNSVVNDSVTVEDTNGQQFQFSESGSENYLETFTCGIDEGSHVNTATIVETGQQDSAEVRVHCYELTVTKDATTSLDRDWEWTIDKTGDQSELTLSPEQAFTVNYTVDVDTSSTDSNWGVSGNITIQNPNPTLAADLTAVNDLISPDVLGVVDCPALVVPAGGSLICTYSSTLSDTADRLNTATASLQNYDYDFEEIGTANGTTDYSGTAAVSFAEAAINETDECADFSDSPYGVLGTVCADTAPQSFQYSLEVGPYTAESCGLPLTFDNTASFITNDTQSAGSDNWSVNVEVACVCSLTQGYWKTHSSHGPAAHPDDTWGLLANGPETPFFSSGKTYYEVLWTAPQGGNAYYTLAHQYIAAQLNNLNGAVFPPAVQTAFDAATVLFNTYTPEQVAAMKGKNGNTVRQQFTNLAGILGAFNEGETNPAGHCSEVPQ